MSTAGGKRPTCALFLGPTMGGKTTGAAKLCRRVGYRVVVLNGATYPYEEKNCEVSTGEWGEIPLKGHNITYVFEDVHRLKSAEREKVVTLLNYTARHHNSAVILISHSVSSNGLFSLLSFLTHVFVTQDRINLRMLKILLKYYMYPETCHAENSFLSLPPRGYLQLSPPSLEYHSLNSSLEKMDQDASPSPDTSNKEEEDSSAPFPKEKITPFFSHLPQKEVYNSLTDFVLRIIPARYISEKDLSISYRDKKGKNQKISLLDYLHFLATNAPPPLKILSFQRHMYKTTCFPHYLVKNTHMIQHCQK